MEIGKPKRTYRVEPLREPVPAKRERDEPRRPVRKAPTTSPAK
jgi:hypothetical protein